MDANNAIRHYPLFIPLLFLAFALALGWLFAPFLMYILVAALLATATAGPTQAFSRLLSGAGGPGRWQTFRELLVALAATLFFALFIFGPLAYFIAITSKQLLSLDPAMFGRYMKTLQAFMADPPFPQYTAPVIETLRENWNLQTLDAGFFKTLLLQTGGVLKKAGGVIAQIGWILFFYFLIVFYRQKLSAFLFGLFPFKEEERRLITAEFTGTLSVVFYGTLSSMFLQGLAFGLLMAAIGGYNALYLGIMAGFFSVVPVVGASVIYLPVAGMEFIDGHWLNGGVIILFAFVVMGFVIDNLVRLWLIGVLKRTLDFTHTIGEIPIMLSMIAGLTTVGFWGVIIGPSILSLALASAHLYTKYLKEE